MKDSETRWYHHIFHARVLLTIVFTGLIYLFFIGFGLYMYLAR